MGGFDLDGIKSNGMGQEQVGMGREVAIRTIEICGSSYISIYDRWWRHDEIVLHTFC
jgi:hypothetical protein